MAVITPLPGTQPGAAPPVGGTLFGGGAGVVTPHPTVGPEGGKNSSRQDLLSPHSGMKSTIIKGEPLSRAMGHYGKGHSFSSPTQPMGNAGSSGPKAGANDLGGIRGGTGVMRRIRGGLGPGKMGQPGASDQNYSMNSADVE